MRKKDNNLRNRLKNLSALKDRIPDGTTENDLKHIEDLPGVTEDFFLRFKDQPKFFIHFSQAKKAYVSGKGEVGACVWKEDQADKFIKANAPLYRLEKVKVSDLLNTEDKHLFAHD